MFDKRGDEMPKKAIEIFVNRIEQIAEYYKRHEMEGDYKDLKAALDEYHKNVYDSV